LIARARSLMQQGCEVTSSQAQEVAKEWEVLTQTFAGTDPATRRKMQYAYEQEPKLLSRTGIDQQLLDYIRAAGADAVC